MDNEMSFKDTLANYIQVLAIKAMKYCMENNYKFAIEPYLARNTYEITISGSTTDEYKSFYKYFYMSDLEAIQQLEEIISKPMERELREQEIEEVA